MGIFKKTCPLEKFHLEVYGIHAPKKWKEADCLECEFWKDKKCCYTQAMGSREKLIKRGRPALVKKAAMGQPVNIRKQHEQEALKAVGFTSAEITEYWTLSQEFDLQWETESEDKRQEILDSLDQWKVHLEKGDSPAVAGNKVKEWLKQRDSFRRSSGGDNPA